MVATFEDFARRSVEEFINELSKNFNTDPSCDFNKLPEKIILHHYFSTLELATKGPRFELTEKKDRLADIMQACKNIINNNLNPQAFTNTYGNPNSQTLRSVYGGLNILNIFNAIKEEFFIVWQKSEIESFIADKLDEIVVLRHSIAHTTSFSNKSRQDVLIYNRFIRVLVNSITIFLNSHVETVMNNTKEH